MFTRICAFRHDPARAFLDAGFLEQQRKRHSGPLAATGEPVRILSGRIRRNPRWAAGSRRGAVPVALDEMKSRHGRQAFQFVHGEYQWTVDHAVDQQTVLPRIDVGRFKTVGNDKVKRSRRDHSYLVLKGRSKPERHRLILQPALWIVDAAGANRLHEGRAPTVEVQFVNLLQSRFGSNWKRTRGCPNGQPGQRRAVLQKPPAIRILWIHKYPL